MSRDDAAPPHSRPTDDYWLIQRIAYAIAGLGGKDRFLQHRAAGMVRNSGILPYLRDGGRYVDVGSGFGHITEKVALAERALATRWVAIDPAIRPSRPVRRRLNRAAARRVSFVMGLGEMLPLRDGCVDGVVLFFVLHHVPRALQATVLTEARRVVGRDGRVFLIEDTPADAEQWSRVVRWDRRSNWESGRAEHHYRSVAEWEALAAELGFRLIDCVPFQDISPKRAEGVIPHTNFVLQYDGGSTPPMPLSVVTD